MKPLEINYHSESRVLDVEYEDGEKFSMNAEYLRCFSPSAEVQGHGSGQGKLQVGKENVRIDKIEPVGNYAVVLHFDDEHNTGIYSWDWLYTLGKNQERNWTDYLKRLKAAGHERKAD